MPALDSCHPQIIRALSKSGWDVAITPYVIPIDLSHRLYIDIEAHHVELGHVVVVEVKCFQDSSAHTTDLYTGLGQYLVYRSLLAKQGASHKLFLAIPLHAWNGIMQRIGIDAIRENAIKLLIIDFQKEVIVKWIE
jgi:XisH protein